MAEGKTVKISLTIMPYPEPECPPNSVCASATRTQLLSLVYDRNGLITGMFNGMNGMKAGGVRELLIPASQAYGAAGNAALGIKPDQDLRVFVELKEIAP